MSIVAGAEHHAVLKQRFEKIYDDVDAIAGGFRCNTANGVLRIVEAATFAQTIGPLPKAISKNEAPCIVGMDLRVSVPQTLLGFLKTSAVAFRYIDNGYALLQPELTANTVLRFIEQ